MKEKEREMSQSGCYELLASLMLRAHGSLQEVKFIEKTRNFVLVFGDGTELEPNTEYKRGKWYKNHLELVSEFVDAGYGGDPLDVLSFGYSGTGSNNLAVLIKACGFENASAVTSGENFNELPVVLRPDGKFYGD